MGAFPFQSDGKPLPRVRVVRRPKLPHRRRTRLRADDKPADQYVIEAFDDLQLAQRCRHDKTKRHIAHDFERRVWRALLTYLAKPPVT